MRVCACVGENLEDIKASLARGDFPPTKTAPSDDLPFTSFHRHLNAYSPSRKKNMKRKTILLLYGFLSVVSLVSRSGSSVPLVKK